MSITSVKQQLSTNPNSVDALSEAALYYVSRADFKAATKYYQKLTRLDPNNCKAWTALGHCYLLMKEYQRCFQAYDRVFLSYPESSDPELWYGIGLLYYKFEKYKLALRAFEKLLSLSPDFKHVAEVLYKLGNINKFQQSFPEAIDNYRKSLAYDLPQPRKIETLCKMGVCLYKASQAEKAEECFMTALSYEPGNFKTIQFIGWMYLCQKDYARAIEYFTSAEGLAEENQAEVGDLVYLRGLCYFQTNLFTECEAAWKASMDRNPTSHVYNCSVGVLAMRNGEQESGVLHFEKASQIQPCSADAFYNLGVYYEGNGKAKEAIAQYSKASELGDSQAKESVLYLKRNGTPRQPHFRHPDIDIADHPFSIVLPENPLQPNHLPDIDILLEPARPTQPLLSPQLPPPSQFPQLPQLPPLLPKPVLPAMPAFKFESSFQLPPLPRSMLESQPEPQSTEPTQLTQGMDPATYHQLMQMMNYPRPPFQ
jgi:tetratricopeptide (TPR) repeat protein